MISIEEIDKEQEQLKGELESLHEVNQGKKKTTQTEMAEAYGAKLYNVLTAMRESAVMYKYFMDQLK